MTNFSLPAGADADATPWTGVYPETDVGHVHLHVSDLTRAEASYCDLLGLDVTQRGYPGALFLSAGGYHRHLGANVWVGAGAPPPPLEAVGLWSFALVLPNENIWQILYQHVQKAGIRIEDRLDHEHAAGVLARDRDGNGVELLFEKKNQI